MSITETRLSILRLAVFGSGAKTADIHTLMPSWFVNPGTVEGYLATGTGQAVNPSLASTGRVFAMPFTITNGILCPSPVNGLMASAALDLGLLERD